MSGGAEEVVTAFHSSSKTYIYRGNGVGSLTNQATLYSDTSSSLTRVTALAGGNFKTGTGFAGDEFAVAIKNADNTETVWRGNTTTAHAAQLWTNTAAPWSGFNIGALAANNPNSTAAQEVAASLHSSTATYLLWDVTAGLASQVYSDTSGSLWRVRVVKRIVAPWTGWYVPRHGDFCSGLVASREATPQLALGRASV